MHYWKTNAFTTLIVGYWIQGSIRINYRFINLEYRCDHLLYTNNILWSTQLLLFCRAQLRFLCLGRTPLTYWILSSLNSELQTRRFFCPPREIFFVFSARDRKGSNCTLYLPRKSVYFVANKDDNNRGWIFCPKPKENGRKQDEDRRYGLILPVFLELGFFNQKFKFSYRTSFMVTTIMHQENSFLCVLWSHNIFKFKQVFGHCT